MPAPTPEDVRVGVPLENPPLLLVEVGLLVLVEGALTVGLVPVAGSGVVGGMVPDPVAPLELAVTFVEPAPVEPEPLEEELAEPEPEEDPPATPGVALPGGQTTPGFVSGSWSVVPLLAELSVPWLPSPDGGWVTQMPPVPEPLVSVPEPLVSVPEPLVSVPEPLVSVPEPLVPVPDPLSPEVLLSWPLLVGFVVVSVGFVVVSVGALPVSWPVLESLEQEAEPLVSVGCVVAPVSVVWVEPSVGQVVT
jgi:signal-induced proliferation-associated 1 like protein 3